MIHGQQRRDTKITRLRLTGWALSLLPYSLGASYFYFFSEKERDKTEKWWPAPVASRRVPSEAKQKSLFDNALNKRM